MDDGIDLEVAFNIKHPHPWWGRRNPILERGYFKTSAADMVELSESEKQQLYPSPSWADNRRVKMHRAELAQRLAGNFMLPGEWQTRVDIFIENHRRRLDSRV